MMKLLIHISLYFLSCTALTTAISANTVFGQTSVRKNYTDTEGQRQGYWEITGSISIEEGYKNDQLIEEGEYVDDKRNGIWKKYYPTGAIKSKIEYAENHPSGHYKVYYPSGVLEEEGDWTANRNVGKFTRYHENGKPAQKFSFNTAGKRQGTQEYFHENGRLILKVEVDNGIVHGEYNAFYTDGSPREEKRMTNGTVETGSLMNYEPRTKIKDVADLPQLPRAETRIAESDQPNLTKFEASGFNTLYNKDKQVTQVGKFSNGRLSDGKWYRYDENGLLRRVEVYKGGRFVGYGIIDDANN